MGLLNLDFGYVLPYCELTFDIETIAGCQIITFFPKKFKSGLSAKKNVLWGLSNHNFVKVSRFQNLL